MDVALASTVVDTISAGIVVHDADTGTIRDVNDAFTDMHGYDRDELIGHAIEIVSADTPEYSLDRATSRIQQARDEDSIRFEWRNKRADGTTFPVEVELTPLSLNEGEYVIATVRDNSDRKTQERDLERSEAKYRSLFEDARDAIMLLDDEGFFDCNEMTLELFGFDSVEAFTEQTLWELSPETQPDGTNSREGAQKHIRAAFEEGEAFFEWVHVRDDGTEFPAEVKLSRFQLDGEPALRALVRDITERKETEQAFKQAREQLRQVIDLIPDPIFVKNRDDEILLSNEANATLLGATAPDEVENKPEPEFFPESDYYETLLQRNVDVIESGESSTFEEDMTRFAGEKRIFKTTRMPFKDPETGEEGVLGYARDITEQREYEQDLEEQRDNLESLNQVLRHDIRNDLQLVMAYADLLFEECEDEEVKEYITTIQDRADHAVELTDTAREMAEVMVSTTKDGQQVNLRSVLEKEVSEVQSAYPNAAVTYDTAIPSVSINANDMVSSVFRNLLKNAIQHNDKPMAEVKISATDQHETVTIRVADNGPGVPDDQKKTIFGKGERGLESAGTGIGLYLVETLVTSYDGNVWVEDNDPEGSVFVVELPKAE